MYSTRSPSRKSASQTEKPAIELVYQEGYEAFCDRVAMGANPYTKGTDEFIAVNDSVACITGHLGLSPKLTYAGGARGWVGDNPFIYLDTRKIRALGWEPRLPIRDGILRTLDWLRTNSWVYGKRA